MMTGIELRSLGEPDFDTLIILARRIWVPHYTPLVGLGTVEHILSLRLTHENLRRYIGANDRGMELLWDGESAVGYCSYAVHGNELKLEQLYLLPEYQGRGLGRQMMDHVEARARGYGCAVIFLQVYKGNAQAGSVYAKAGYTLREAVVIDIGGGFVMDDYILEKRLAETDRA